MRPLIRIEPAGPVQAYKTYSVTSPSDRSIVYACEQVGCERWARGWVSPIDERTELGAQQARYIRHQSGRTFTESRTESGLTMFRFASRQRCFEEHRTRPEFYKVRNGDWRGNLGIIRRHVRPADWVEDFTEHQDRIAARQERG